MTKMRSIFMPLSAKTQDNVFSLPRGTKYALFLLSVGSQHNYALAFRDSALAVRVNSHVVVHSVVETADNSLKEILFLTG